VHSKFYITFVICIVISLLCYTLLKKTPLQKDTKAFIVGTAAGYAPWVSINEYGEYEGFDIDTIKAVAEKMNKKLVLADLGSMPSLFIALEQGTVDAIIWGLSITKDRTKNVAMIRYQGDAVSSFPLLFWGNIPPAIQAIDDMKHMAICVEPASSQETVLDAYPFITKLPVEKIDDALLNIRYGKADAAFVEPAIAKKFKNHYPEVQTLEVPLQEEYRVEGVGICVKKDNTSLIAQIENAITLLSENGFIKQCEARWGIA
jgi:ABC-type amino acid transport substrate-binding protein